MMCERYWLTFSDAKPSVVFSAMTRWLERMWEFADMTGQVGGLVDVTDAC
jgi:hypothetical protein